MCGDGEGVLVVPEAMADEVASGAQQLELEERYITSRVAEGLSLDGLYPLGQRYRDDYEQWLRKQDGE
jgi:5-oxopent-3-ene-1,2,5-tricarboxylate decarboxylase/2-hydroxyhepta-2,4-diene-1,7-dioate isomerase